MKSLFARGNKESFLIELKTKVSQSGLRVVSGNTASRPCCLSQPILPLSTTHLGKYKSLEHPSAPGGA